MISRIFRAVCLLPWIGLASVRVSAHFHRLNFDDLPATLTAVPPLPAFLRDPLVIRSLVVRLSPILPPPGMGRCLKRSLLLLDLWSRCGIEPVLHLGIKRNGDVRLFHAWVTSAGRPDLSSEAPALTEIFSQTARSPN